MSYTPGSLWLGNMQQLGIDHLIDSELKTKLCTKIKVLQYIPIEERRPKRSVNDTKKLMEAEKMPFIDEAKKLRDEHKRKYPDYRLNHKWLPEISETQNYTLSPPQCSAKKLRVGQKLRNHFVKIGFSLLLYLKKICF